MSMKNIAGQVVSGEDFFERPGLMQEFQRKIETGSSILISAPRRVGKTSLMCRIRDVGLEGYYFIYLIVQSVKNENEYFKRILDEILKSDFLNPLQRFSKKAYQSLKDRAARIKEIGKTIIFEKESKINYLDEFIDTIKDIDLEGQKIVLLIDEFSQAIVNIKNKEGEQPAIHFLQSNRELRQNREISKKVQFVFAGSIGLENIVNRLNSIDLVNDLNSLKVPPLSARESHNLMLELMKIMPFTLSNANRDYILEKIKWYIPFYIQLAMQEISNLFLEEEREAKESENKKRKKISNKMIDRAFLRMLELRTAFEHWHTRLRKAFKKEEYSFAIEFLNTISREENANVDGLFNLAQKYNLNDTYKEIVNTLIYDGYINNNEDQRIFRFNSPLLRIWWRKNVAY